MAAFATLVTNEDYARGALALLHSLRRVGTPYPLLVLAPRDVDGLEALERAGAEVRIRPPLELSDEFRTRHSRKAQHEAAPFTKGEKPAFHDPLDNFVKLRVWELEEHERIVFLDADTLVLRSIDRLMHYPEFSAAPNLYETLADMHRLNAGVFVARPDRARLDAMCARLDAPGVFWRRTDQTFLEAEFPDWHGLPYIFNALQYLYFNLPGLWRWDAIRVVHYQYEKPWQDDHPKRAALAPLIDLWWRFYEGPAVELPADP